MESATISRPEEARRAGAGAEGLRSVAVPVVIWAALIAVGWLVGTVLNDAGTVIMLDAPPLYGDWDLRYGPGVLIPVGVGAALVAGAPVAVRRAGWKGLLGLVFGAGIAWPVALALLEGAQEVNEPLEWFTQYLAAVPQVGSPGEFIANFNARIEDYPAHVTAHPPLMVLVFWMLEQVGLGGSWPAAVLILLTAATAAPATLIALRALTDEATARRAAPYLVLAPIALSIATTGDALFMAIAAWSICALVLAIVRVPDRRADLLALAGGIGFGILIFLSFGLILVSAIPLAVAIGRRRIRPLVVASAGVLAIVAAFLAAGYWWIDGLVEVRAQYAESVASTRPYAYFVFNNWAALALGALGPVIAVALFRLRDRRVWWLVAGAFAGMALADLSGMSKAEVERIWLPFAPWVLVAAVALPAGSRAMRGMLGVQAGLTLLIAVSVWTIW